MTVIIKIMKNKIYMAQNHANKRRAFYVSQKQDM